MPERKPVPTVAVAQDCAIAFMLKPAAERHANAAQRLCVFNGYAYVSNLAKVV
jgi:hypothetical protein